MEHKRKKTIRTTPARWFFLCAAIFGLTAGCAQTASQALRRAQLPLRPVSTPEDSGWRFVQFRMDRPAEQTRWERDLLIAHRVIAPLIRAHDDEMGLWRFHRRSAEDQTGHQFSFLFYSSAAVADRVHQTVVDDPLVARMLSAGVIQKVITDDVDKNHRPNVGDTSDPEWSPVMKDNWPHYIMGVSRMWLGMVEQVSRESGIADDPTVGQLLVHYGQVNRQVTRIWRKEGYHALLHHLNAIYGYEALEYWEKHLKSF
jgi:hypothetical protein